MSIKMSVAKNHELLTMTNSVVELSIEEIMNVNGGNITTHHDIDVKSGMTKWPTWNINDPVQIFF